MSIAVAAGGRLVDDTKAASGGPTPSAAAAAGLERTQRELQECEEWLTRAWAALGLTPTGMHAFQTRMYLGELTEYVTTLNNFVG